MISGFITVNEDGKIFLGDGPITDPAILSQFYDHLQLNEKHTLTTALDNQDYIVEVFDAPIVAERIFKNTGELWELESTTGFQFSFSLDDLFVDAFDRFYGITGKTFFVLSKQAQSEFFDIVDSFDDDTFSVNGKQYQLGPFYDALPEISRSPYWSQVYVESEKPGWDLNGPAEALKDMLPRLKLPKSRVLVLGSGYGHDAAHFAQNGHVVTAVDFSREAVDGAKLRYAHLTNIRWHQGDLFAPPAEFFRSFDLIFEHTCFCAVEPDRRAEMVKIWQQCLSPGGHLMAVFFTMFKREGPPYGVTEWELRKRLEKKFQFIFWGRWRKSIAPRLGRELFVYAQKISAD